MHSLLKITNVSTHSFTRKGSLAAAKECMMYMIYLVFNWFKTKHTNKKKPKTQSGSLSKDKISVLTKSIKMDLTLKTTIFFFTKEEKKIQH